MKSRLVVRTTNVDVIRTRNRSESKWVGAEGRKRRKKHAENVANVVTYTATESGPYNIQILCMHHSIMPTNPYAAPPAPNTRLPYGFNCTAVCRRRTNEKKSGNWNLANGKGVVARLRPTKATPR